MAALPSKAEGHLSLSLPSPLGSYHSSLRLLERLGTGNSLIRKHVAMQSVGTVVSGHVYSTEPDYL